MDTPRTPGEQTGRLTGVDLNPVNQNQGLHVENNAINVYKR